MRVFDVFSMLPAKELSIEQIEDIFLKSCDGVIDDIYVVVHEISENAGNNIIECKNELISEGKNVACIMKDDTIVALVGYKS